MFQTYGNRRVLDAKVFTLLSPCEICGGKIGTGTNFNPSTSVFPALYLFLTTCFSYQEDKSVKQIAILFGNGEHKKKNSVALVRERTIPTERPPPVGEVNANFCG